MDFCPSGWHLPKGGNKSNESNNEWWNLIVNGITGGSNPANYASSTSPYYATGTSEGIDTSKAMRTYPNNFVYSGRYASSTESNYGTVGYYWSSTVNNSNFAQIMNLGDTFANPATRRNSKYLGETVRCVADYVS